MSEQVSVEVGPGGGPVAVKRASDEPGRARLRHEAELLEAARSPGVVELVAFHEGDDGAVLSTAWLGGGTIATATLPPKKLASAAAALAFTVALLHERGIAHRRITADHVLLDSAARVILAGFAEAGTDGSATDAADDVRSIGELVAGKLPVQPPPVLRLRSHIADAEVVDRLRAIALRASDPDPSRRPSARALAGLFDELDGSRPHATGPIRLGRPEPTAAATAAHPLAPALDAARSAFARGRSRMVARALAAVSAVALAIAVGVGARSALAGSGTGATPRIAPTTAVASTKAPPTQAPTTTSAVARVWPTTSVAIAQCTPANGAGARVDIDRDGCPDTVTIEAGAIRVDDRRYEFGEPDDAITVADWDCDGLDTAALVRPTTGEVFVFDAWATVAAPLTARLVARVPDATSVAPPDGDCGVLTVVLTDGSRTPLALEVGAP